MFLKIVKNFAVYSILSFLSQASISLLWLLVAWKLAPASIGLYSLVLFLVDFFGAINMFGLDSAVTRFYNSEAGFRPVFKNALFLFAGASVLTLCLFLYAVRLLPALIPGLSRFAAGHTLLLCILIPVNTFANFTLMHYIALRRSRDFAALQVSKILIYCFFAVVFVLSGFDIIGLFYALLISAAAVCAIFLLKERESFGDGGFSLPAVRSLSGYAFPMMLYCVFGIFVVYLNRILLDKYADLIALGIYSFFLTLILQFNGLWSSFNRAWTPEVFGALTSDRPKALERITMMLFVSVFLYLAGMLVLLVLGELFLFRMVFKSVYVAHRYIFYILLMVPVFTGVHTIAYPLYYYEKKTHVVFLITLVVSCVSILITIPMIRYYGSTGAALSFLYISVLSVLAYVLVFRKIVAIPRKVVVFSLWLALLVTSGITLYVKFPRLPVMVAVIAGALALTVFSGSGYLRVFARGYVLQPVLARLRRA
jgi:O-antigen/teichoic acid export membrane protein